LQAHCFAFFHFQKPNTQAQKSGFFSKTAKKSGM